MSADLDREIDRAIESMLDVEPPARLRARVIASIEGGSSRRRSRVLVAVPIAAIAVAALLVLVLMPSRDSQPPQQTSAAARDVQLPSPATPVSAAQRSRQESAPMRVRREPRVFAAAVREPETAPGIEALAAPAPLAVDTLAAPAASTMPSIQPTPLRLTALEVVPIEMPLDAARGVDR
jgi:hypothetical protein